MEPDFLETVLRARDGDDEAFRTLVERYSPMLRAVGRHYFRSSFDLEDTLQEVWTKVWQNLDTLREPVKFPAWLAQIMRYHSLKRIQQQGRRAKGRVSLDLEARHDLVEGFLSDGTELEMLVERRELRKLVEEVLEGMQEIYGMPLRLHYLEGMGLKEMGEVLDLPASTLKWRLHQGRALFRKAVGDSLLEGYITIIRR